MLVSTFELLVKRIAPLAPGGSTAPVNAPFRRVVQGYFLIITNLDPSRTANFFLKFTIPALPASPETFDREIVVGDPSNVRTGYDIAARDNVTLPLALRSSDANVKTFNTGRFSIGPLQTASVNLLPNLGNPDVLTREKLEIRGTVELLQTRSPIFGEFFNGVPAVDVLVTPEIRGTFLDNDYPSADTTNELDFDQINYGLPVASGKGRNTVESVDPFVIGFELGELLSQNLPGFNEQLSQLGLVALPLEQGTPVPVQ